MDLWWLAGNYGNTLDGRNDPVKSSAADAADDDEAPLMAVDEDKDEEKDAMDEEWHCMTEPAHPLTNDRSFVQQCECNFYGL